MLRLIMFLIRIKLGLKKGERFQFANQKSEYDRYYFTATNILKENWSFRKGCYYTTLSNIKLNYILSDECKITKCEKLSEC